MFRQGFTLVELLVVIAIIGLISSIALTSLAEARSRARDSKRVQNMIQLRNALELYAANHNGLYPPDPNFGNGSVDCGDTGDATCDQAGDWGLSCWECEGLAAMKDNNRLQALQPYLSTRPLDPFYPNPDFFSESWLPGYVYKTCPGPYGTCPNCVAGRQYTLYLRGTVENINNVPPNLRYGSNSMIISSKGNVQPWPGPFVGITNGNYIEYGCN